MASIEQQARDMLMRAGLPEAERLSSGSLVEIANLFVGIIERDKRIAKLEKEYAVLRAEERERCAELCDKLAEGRWSAQDCAEEIRKLEIARIRRWSAQDCADEIRKLEDE